jgi:outer membrane autotransporter protein
MHPRNLAVVLEAMSVRASKISIFWLSRSRRRSVTAWVFGLSANTAIAEATSIYLRYEVDISGQDSAHALTAGVRVTW